MYFECKNLTVRYDKVTALRGISLGLEGAGNVVTDPGLFFRISTVITLTGGTMFLMWLGEQITARGIGNGISLIIMSGIVAELPSAIAGMLELGRQGALSTGLILVVIAMVHSDNPAANRIILGVFATGVAVAVVLIASHSGPFEGEISVKPSVLLQVMPETGPAGTSP